MTRATNTAAAPLLSQAENRPRGSDLAALILSECERAGSTAGSRLPTERQLAASLGVTRSAVRHALDVLEAAGRVSREVGRGTFLRGDPTAGPAGANNDIGPAGVMDARDLIEPHVLPLVIANATVRDFEEIDRTLAGGAGAATGEEFEAWDFAFHHAIVVASHNHLLVRMYAAIEAARQGQLWGNLKRRNDSIERRAAYQADHRQIVDALRVRELDLATDATRTHLERVRLNLLGALESTPGD